MRLHPSNFILFSLVLLFGRYFGRIPVSRIGFLCLLFLVSVFFIPLQSNFPSDFILLGPFGFIGGYSLSRFGQNPCVRKTGVELARGIIRPTPTHQTRNIHTLVEIKSKIPPEKNDKTSGHYACVDLTPDEINLLKAGHTLTKDKVVIATSWQVVNGKKTVFLSLTNLEGKDDCQFAVNEMMTCAIGKARILAPAIIAWNQLIECWEQMSKNNGSI